MVQPVVRELGDEADTRDVAEQESHLMEALGRCGRAGANVAIEDGKAEANPVHSRLFFKENNQRVRYLTDNEEKRPREAIGETQWPMVAVAIHTGLRQSAISPQMGARRLREWRADGPTLEIGPEATCPDE